MKKTLLITGCIVLSMALIIGIVFDFTGHTNKEVLPNEDIYEGTPTEEESIDIESQINTNPEATLQPTDTSITPASSSPTATPIPITPQVITPTPPLTTTVPLPTEAPMITQAPVDAEINPNEGGLSQEEEM